MDEEHVSVLRAFVLLVDLHRLLAPGRVLPVERSFHVAGRNAALASWEMASTSTEVLVTSESRMNSSCLPTSVRKRAPPSTPLRSPGDFSITSCIARWHPAGSASASRYPPSSPSATAAISPFPALPLRAIMACPFDPSNTGAQSAWCVHPKRQAIRPLHNGRFIRG